MYCDKHTKTNICWVEALLNLHTAIRPAANVTSYLGWTVALVIRSLTSVAALDETVVENQIKELEYRDDRSSQQQTQQTAHLTCKQ